MPTIFWDIKIKQPKTARIKGWKPRKTGHFFFQFNLKARVHP